MTHVHNMSIELLLIGTVVVFLLKVAVYTAATCFVVRYAIRYDSRNK
jgi:hypothetical protein